MKLVTFVIFTFILSFSCGSQKLLPSGNNAELDSPLSRINHNSDSTNQKPQTLQGYYKGYDGKECNFADSFCKNPPLTRSDWVFSDGVYCIYVTSRNSNNLNPMHDNGKKIEIQVIVRENESKQKFLQLIKINQTN